MSQTITQFIDTLAQAFREGDTAAASKQVEAENVGRLQEFYRTLARGDFPAAVDCMAGDIEIEIHAPAEFSFVSRARGPEAVLAALQANFSKVEDQRPETLALVAQGDAVIVLARERGRLRLSGKPYDVQWVQCYRFRDGKIARFREIAASGMLAESTARSRN
jgi:ketosteroid isomerase-like protein